MQFKTKIIKHSGLTNEELIKIVELKMQHWDYDENEQISWINKNISTNDLHLMVNDIDNRLIAYLNMIHLDISDDYNYSFLGIGNVSVDKSFSGRGYGLLLMNISTFFLKLNKFNGLLLCKEPLKEFYKKSGWHLYNGSLFINERKFEGLIFSMNTIYSDIIKTNKSF